MDDVLDALNVEIGPEELDFLGLKQETLRDKLAVFYAQRTLTKSPVTLADQAEVAYLLSSGKFSKTTGQIISVDGGLHEAFLR